MNNPVYKHCVKLAGVELKWIFCTSLIRKFTEEQEAPLITIVCFKYVKTVMSVVYNNHSFFGTFPKLPKHLLVSSVSMSARPSAWKNSTPTGRISIIFYI